MTKLREALLDRIEELRAAGVQFSVLYEQAYQDTFRLYIRRGDYRDVVDFALSEFDSGGQENLVQTLSDDLKQAGQVQEVIRLWKGYAAIRQRIYWNFIGWSKKVDKILLPVSALEEFRRKHPKQPMREKDTYEIVARLGGAETARRLAIEEKKVWVLSTLQRLHTLLTDMGHHNDAENVANDIVAIDTEKKRAVRKDVRQMDFNLFWELIDESSTADSNIGKVELLGSKLATFDPSAIKRFAVLLNDCMDQLNHWDLWAVAWISRNGCSDDDFDYFKAWIIMQGRAVFESVIASPLSVTEHVHSQQDIQCEALLHTPFSVYEEKTSRPLRLSSRNQSKIKGKSWTEAELQDRYPAVWNRIKQT